jgi:hypothetical protein
MDGSPKGLTRGLVCASLVTSNERKGFSMSNIDFRTGLFGPVSEHNLHSVAFTLDNGVILSVGVSKNHYVSPRNDGGMFPQRDVVEIALLDAEDMSWLTRQFFEDEMGETLGDDVTTLKSSKLLGFMNRVRLWERS